jgi:hypothetical protein
VFNKSTSNPVGDGLDGEADVVVDIGAQNLSGVERFYFKDVAAGSVLFTPTAGAYLMVRRKTDPTIYAVYRVDKETTAFSNTRLYHVTSLFAGSTSFTTGDTFTVQLVPGEQRHKVGAASIANDSDTVTVSFAESFFDDEYVVSATLVNKIDTYPSYFMLAVTAQTASGFTIRLSGNTDTANYVIHWRATRNP